MRPIYLDHTATTPLDPRVMEAMAPYFSGVFGNASSVHAYGREAKQALERARGTVARLIGAEAGEIFFTSGGTESDNLALTGVASAAHGTRKSIVTTKAEHHAVIEPCEHLASRGLEVHVLSVTPQGSPDLETLRAVIDSSTLLVSLMHANNEVGTITPVAGAASIAHAAGALVHTDAVQSAGKIPVNVGELGVDLLTLSAHKMYGPKGIGALFVRKGTPIDPILRGGGQERGRRPGTENVPLTVGFAEAFRLASEEMERESVRLQALRDELEGRIRKKFPEAIVNGDPEHRLPHILNISFDSSRIDLEGEMLVMNMDLQGIAVTSGSACTSGSLQPSHVLLAMGRDKKTARATLRFAFGKSNTPDDVDEVVRSLREVIDRMRKKPL